MTRTVATRPTTGTDALAGAGLHPQRLGTRRRASADDQPADAPADEKTGEGDHQHEEPEGHRRTAAVGRHAVRCRLGGERRAAHAAVPVLGVDGRSARRAAHTAHPCSLVALTIEERPQAPEPADRSDVTSGAMRDTGEPPPW